MVSTATQCIERFVESSYLLVSSPNYHHPCLLLTICLTCFVCFWHSLDLCLTLALLLVFDTICCHWPSAVFCIRHNHTARLCGLFEDISSMAQVNGAMFSGLASFVRELPVTIFFFGSLVLFSPKVKKYVLTQKNCIC